MILVVPSTPTVSIVPSHDSQPTINNIRVAAESSPSLQSSPEITPSFLPPQAPSYSSSNPIIPTSSNPFLTQHTSQDYSRRPEERLNDLSQLPLVSLDRHVSFPSTTDSLHKIQSFSVDDPPSRRKASPTTSDNLNGHTDISNQVPSPPSPPSSSPENLSSQIQKTLPGSSSAIIGSDFSGRPLERNVKRLEKARNADLNLLGESNLMPHSDPHLAPPIKSYLPNDVKKIRDCSHQDSNRLPILSSCPPSYRSHPTFLPPPSRLHSAME